MAQTAVEWLVQWSKENPLAYQSDYHEAIKKAMAIEKEQIIDAYWNGTIDMDKKDAIIMAENFFNHYYKK